MEQVVTPRFRLLIIRHGESEGNLRPDTAYEEDADSSIPLTHMGRLQAEDAGKFINAFFSQPEFLAEHEQLKRQRLEEIAAKKEFIAANPGFAKAFPKDAIIPRELPDKPHVRLSYSPFKRTQQTRDGILKHAHGVISDCNEQPFLYEQLFGLQDGNPKPEVMEMLKHAIKHQDHYKSKGGRHFVQNFMGESRAQVELRMIPFIGSLHRDAERGDMWSHVIVTHGLTARILAKAWMKYDVETSTAEYNPGNCHIRYIEGHKRDERTDYRYIYTGKQEEIKALEAKMGRSR